MEGPCADSEEKREPVGDIETAEVDGLKVLDPRRPIREADVAERLVWLFLVERVVRDLAGRACGDGFRRHQQ